MHGVVYFCHQCCIGLLSFWWTQVLALLPFRAMLGFPIDLMLGRLTPEHIGVGLGLQLFWLVALFGGVQLLWQRGLRRYGAVGA